MQRRTGNDCLSAAMFVDTADAFQWFCVTQQHSMYRLCEPETFHMRSFPLEQIVVSHASVRPF